MVARRLVRSLVVAALSLVAVAASPGSAEGHPLHTTMMDLSYDPASRALNVIIRVFADDFSAAVVPSVPRRAEIVIPSDTAILRYVTGRVGVTGPGGRVSMRWCGLRREGKVLFLCLRGSFKLEFRDRTVILTPGEFLIVPRGVEHRPVADEEVEVLLFEPADTRNTGNVEHPTLTAPPEPKR